MPWAGMSLTKVNLDLRRLWSTFASAVAHLPTRLCNSEVISLSSPLPAREQRPLTLLLLLLEAHCPAPRCGKEARVYPFASHPVPGPPQSIAKDFLSPPGLALGF